MRLKTLRKERPAFENEGAVINGSRMDLSNSEFKPAKHRTNNTFALPTSLNSDLSSLNLSPSNQTPELTLNYSQQFLPRRPFPLASPSQPTHVSTYQAIEAAYLEHGIRIHLNSTTAAAVTQQTNLTTENLIEKKSTNNIHRHKAFVNRNPSRSSSALHYSTTINDTNQDSRPFSALQQTSTVDFEQKTPNYNSSTQPTDSQNHFQITQPLTNNYSSSSLVASERYDHTQLAILNDITSTETLVNNDPDLAYMSSLLQTTNGDSFRDTIRRRAGLRGTFAVHRHPQISLTTSNPKFYEKSPVIHSPNMNHRNSLLRTATIAVAPTTTSTSTTTTTITPSSKKLEKDILRHASRIRTNHIKESFLRHQNSLKTKPTDHLSLISHSPTRKTHQNKQNHTSSPSRSISLVSFNRTQNKINQQKQNTLIV